MSKIKSKAIKLDKYIDFTLLKPNTSYKDMENFIDLANDINPYAICISPALISNAVKLKAGIKVCTVLNFPLGIQSARSIMEDYNATQFYADEFDIVLPLFLIASRDWGVLSMWCKNMRDEIGPNCLKGIIEIGHWELDQIEHTCRILIDNGWNFVKTSTGLGPRNTTLEDIKLLKKI
jgi:deoxyribose-phosphate aldolase